jgi:hypothetical protein
MKKKTAILLAWVLLMPCAFGTKSLSQTKEGTTETKAEVPALARFHTVIYKIWHTAWPDSNYAMLSAALPELHRHMEDLTSAKLPGILRDKEAAWQEALGKLRQIIVEYGSAVEAKDNPRLLNAAEKLHSQYEKLVRVVRPAMKELEEFHVVLYTLYHHQMAIYNPDSVKATVVELKKTMEILKGAKIPDRLQRKSSMFITARAQLSTSVDTLSSTVSSKDERRIRAAVNNVHANYQILEKVFD